MRRATINIDAMRERVAISIHALHEESDEAAWHTKPIVYIFQSTLSMRRATDRAIPVGAMVGYFNPRSP